MIASVIDGLQWRAIVAIPAMIIGCVMANILIFPLGLGWSIPINFLWPLLFYYLIHRPAVMPIWGCFLLGLIYDLIAGGPLGLHAGLFMIWRLILLRQRRFLSHQGFLMYWLTFAGMIGITNGLIWLFVSLIHLHPIGIWPLIMATAALIAVYPVPARLFSMIDRWAFER